MLERIRRRLPHLLLAAMALQGGDIVRRTGVTYDEPMFVAAGCEYWTHGLGIATNEQPPLISYLHGLPLRLLRPSAPHAPGLEDMAVSGDVYAQMLLFGNRISPRAMLRAARLATLSLALLLGFVLWRWTRAFSGENASAAALAFLAFEPTFLAHASLATNDIGVPVFGLMSMAAWERFLSTSRLAWACGAGLAAGAAISSKATGLILLPSLAAALAWTRLKRARRRPPSIREDLLPLVAAAALAGAFVTFVYGPSNLWRFAEMVRFQFSQARHGSATYLLGRVYPQGHPLYYPIVLLAKTPLPLLGLACFGLFSRDGLRKHPETMAVLGAFSALFLTATLISGRQLGVRYLLALYPVLCVAAGVGAAALWKQGGRGRWGAAAAVAWHAMGALAILPYNLTYFNELAGGASRGRYLLADHNLDWGQALPDLRRFLDKNPGGLILSYFGKDCPMAYGLDAQEILCTPGYCTGRPTLLPVEEGREWLAVGATKWQGAYETGTPAFFWLRSRAPAAVLANSMFVYDVTFDADAHLRLARLYDLTGRPDAAARERRRAAGISGGFSR